MKFTMPWTVSNGHANGATDKIEVVRSALGRRALGREVAMNRVADIAATLGPTIATLGRQRMRQAGERAQTLSHELRQVRVTTEPRKSGVLPGNALLGGLGIGAGVGVGVGIAAMYLLDPERGRSRRALLRDKLAKWTRIGRATAEGKAKDLRNRTVGVMAEARRTVTTGIGVVDEPLIAQELAYEAWPEGTRVPTI